MWKQRSGAGGANQNGGGGSLKMKPSLYMILVLGVVGLLSGILLVVVYKYASPRIEAIRREELKRAIFKVIPQTETYKETVLEGESIYKCFNAEGKIEGLAFLAEGSGHQGKIKIMVGTDVKLTTIKGIQILENVETPGLGSRIDSEEFKSQFYGLDISDKISYIRREAPSRPGEIQAITGATITSRSVINILNKRIKRIRQLIDRYEK